jgi:hypothetical protein
MVDQIKPLVKHLKPEHHREAIGFDTLTVSPPGDNGNQYLDVIVDYYIKHCQILTALRQLQQVYFLTYRNGEDTKRYFAIPEAI